jgi:putative flippase GtrA
LNVAEDPPPAQGGIRQKIVGLDEKYHVFKLAKFAAASGTGFLLAEGLLTLGVLLLYGKLSAPGDAYSSPKFLAFDIAALASGVALSFFLNERLTVRAQQAHKNGGSSSLLVRLLKFEGVNAMGNATILGVQFALLAALSITPVIGNVVGAIVSYPVTYLISMHFVWKPAPGSHMERNVTQHRKTSPKRGGPLAPPLAGMVFLALLYVLGQVLRRRRR